MSRASPDADGSHRFLAAGPDKEELEVHKLQPNRIAERAKEQVVLLAPAILTGRDGIPIKSSTFGMDRYVVSVRDSTWDGDDQNLDTLAAANAKIRKLEEDNEAWKAETACFREAMLRIKRTLNSAIKGKGPAKPVPGSALPSQPAHQALTQGDEHVSENQPAGSKLSDQVHPQASLLRNPRDKIHISRFAKSSPGCIR
ncbi:hypothetical protein PpBr36_02621 [Pyricularia pennisetigena]|uniref:hypothetical protein n=1 Tax=Pyricularia pennisetigena TaxID=1578925 RepID=UPI00114F3B81|nr:hypothetical protein PpBr36_02621 [Pyricularia pennisetigena]TLS30995.1 hypothetical protein PpBr36_02621 [Pyricularia pennisetigena]